MNSTNMKNWVPKMVEYLHLDLTYLRSTRESFYNYSSSLYYELPNKKLAVAIACAILFFSAIFVRSIIHRILKRRRVKISLGQRPVCDIKYLKDIVDEIHYAACYCCDYPQLVPRCIKLLKLCPEACNFAKPEHNYTPFLRCCWNGCIELISYMISIGADIYAKTDAGEGGVYLATYAIIRKKKNDFRALKILLNAGLDINESRTDGYTALHLAATRGHTRLVKWLLAHGADTSPSGSAHPAHLALIFGHYKTAEILNTHNEKNCLDL